MASFSLEDQSGAVRVVAFPDAFERYERILVDGSSVLVTATLRANDPDHVELGLEEATGLEGIEARKASALRVELHPEELADRDAVERLHELILRHDGRMQLRMRLVGPTWTADFVPSRVLGVNPSTLIPALATVLGPGRVEYVFD